MNWKVDFKELIPFLGNTIYIDFDARTGHNHGTKFRMKQGYWSSLYSKVEKIM